MSADITDPGHGHSPAAWTAVTIMLTAITIGMVAFVLDQPVIVWASVGLLVVGLLVGAIMKKAGYGVGGAKVTAKAH
ncbi:MAG: hypothetical protein B5766_09835 [Candidatus Lumbricidophila eiseniae]|uniref:Uncharacterized protein n=1 Tax=Candidatus Lumbricidiphila eiseniae TaxID=1969409 RepID=A0A2A6FPE1_9MICO|nr:MAG: hypothetical protein B5766_09835 [Candidatus Lumbricidophila eiseniae]